MLGGDRRSTKEGLVTLLFSVSMLLGATLLFSIQPLFTQMVLPLLGGSPVVWNTAVLFFQAALLAGYLYAHFLDRFLPLKRQLLIHAVVLLVAVTSLPIAVAAGWEPPVDRTPLLWLVALLCVSIGLPVFATAATAPLLQSWYARTHHRDAHDPYFLYGASNLGSLLALLSYPVVVAPLLGLGGQASLWSGGYLGLAGLILLSGIIVVFGEKNVSEKPEAPAISGPLIDNVGWSVRLKWLVLAFVPSSILLGVTLHISTDIAATPFLWVIPLTIYLLTYILVFSKTRILPHRFMIEVEAILLIVISLYFWKTLTGGEFLIHLATLFAIAMVCHGELARLRPVTAHLTEFYFWLSLGGVLGGAFNVLVAPVVFDTVLEYPLILAAACLLRPVLYKKGSKFVPGDLFLPGALALALGAVAGAGYSFGDFGATAEILIFLVLGVALYSFSYRPLRFAGGIAAVLFVPLVANHNTTILAQERSFFGVYEVTSRQGGEARTLMHGTTLHGVQLTDEDRATEPLSYYSRTGPLGEIFRAASAQGKTGKIAAVGLGVGTIACYAEPGETITFFEIDPAVEELARNPDLFTYLEKCGRELEVRLGDARRTLDLSNEKFDLIVLDAFSSDAIPVHLLTEEAFGMYFQRLSRGGLIAIHISNKFLDLESVVAELVARSGWTARVKFQSNEDIDSAVPADLAPFILPSHWVVMAEKASTLEGFRQTDGWRELQRKADQRVWTDDYADVFGALRWFD